jgi:hypothetical protein
MFGHGWTRKRATHTQPSIEFYRKVQRFVKKFESINQPTKKKDIIRAEVSQIERIREAEDAEGNGFSKDDNSAI